MVGKQLHYRSNSFHVQWKVEASVWYRMVGTGNAVTPNPGFFGKNEELNPAGRYTILHHM